MRRFLMGSVCALLLFSSSAIAQTAVSFETLTVADSAVALAGTTVLPSGKPAADRCVAILETAQIRYRTDNTAPTSSVGAIAEVGSKIELVGQNSIRQFKAIRTGSVSGVLNVQCYSGGSTGAVYTAPPIPVPSVTGGIAAVSGSAATPGIAFTSDASLDSGFYLIGANNIGASAGGTLRWSWNASGITTTIPVLFSTDNTVDIGASEATRPRTIYLGTSANIGTGLVLRAGAAGSSAIRVTGGLAVMGSGFGTSAAVTGTDTAFQVAVGTSSATSGVIAFSATLAAIPFCVAGMETATATESRVVTTVATTSQVTLYFADDNAGTFHAAAPADNSKVNVICFVGQ